MAGESRSPAKILQPNLFHNDNCLEQKNFGLGLKIRFGYQRKRGNHNVDQFAILFLDFEVAGHVAGGRLLDVHMA